MSPLAVLSRGLSVIWDYWLSRTRDARVGTGRTAAAPLCTCSRPASAAAGLRVFCVTRGRLPMAGSLRRAVMFFFSFFFFQIFFFFFSGFCLFGGFVCACCVAVVFSPPHKAAAERGWRQRGGLVAPGTAAPAFPHHFPSLSIFIIILINHRYCYSVPSMQPRNGWCVLQPVAGLRCDLSSPGLRAGGDGEDLRHLSASGRGGSLQGGSAVAGCRPRSTAHWRPGAGGGTALASTVCVPGRPRRAFAGK